MGEETHILDFSSEGKDSTPMAWRTNYSSNGLTATVIIIVFLYWTDDLGVDDSERVLFVQRSEQIVIDQGVFDGFSQSPPLRHIV